MFSDVLLAPGIQQLLQYVEVGTDSYFHTTTERAWGSEYLKATIVKLHLCFTDPKPRGVLSIRLTPREPAWTTGPAIGFFFFLAKALLPAP